jgi:hypothetical protein
MPNQPFERPADVGRLAGDPPQTSNGDVGVVMLAVSGSGPNSQWFDYIPAFYQPAVRVEWEKDTMSIVLPAATADTMLRRGYARPMTGDEVVRHNALFNVPSPPSNEETTS